MNNSHPEKKLKRIIWKSSGEEIGEKDQDQIGSSSTEVQTELKKRQQTNSHQDCASPRTAGPCMMPLLSVPNLEELNSKSSIVLSGTAKRARAGPSVGAVDIGISQHAYYFQVALPGVTKDPGMFSCEVEQDGKVHVRGETSTGGQTVSRHSRVFDMKLRQQPPPGPFTLSFSLPGPVDPRLFFPDFRSDGILEAVVAKYK